MRVFGTTVSPAIYNVSGGGRRRMKMAVVGGGGGSAAERCP
jgi:hypothetical protein